MAINFATPEKDAATAVRDLDLNLVDIKLDQSAQPRESLNNDRIAEYADGMKAGDQFPPLTVFHDGATYWLADGFHRHYAAQHAGRKHIRCHVRQGGLRDAILWSVGANAKHGLARSDADKERAVKRILADDEWGQWSDREVARRCKVDHKTVARIRKAVSGEVPQMERKVQRGGTVYTQKVAKAKPADVRQNRTTETGDAEPQKAVEELTPADPLQSAWDAASEAERDAFLARNNLQFKAEPAATAVTTGNDLREPASAVSGRIIREGDAPRETGHQASEQSQGDGDASCPDTEFANSSTTSSRKTNKPETVTPPPVAVSGPILKPLSKADQIRLLRPNCRHADDLPKCGGSGRRHCRDCEVLEAA